MEISIEQSQKIFEMTASIERTGSKLSVRRVLRNAFLL